MPVPATSGGFRLTETGLSVVGSPSYEQWEQAVDQARTWHTAVQWVIGALVNYGEAHYGERAAQILDASRFDEETIRVYAWVESHVPPEVRRPDLPFHAHQLVAGLPVEAQRAWLARAAEGDEEGKWSTRRLQAELRQAAVAEGATLPCWLVVRCESAFDAEVLRARLAGEGRVVKMHAGTTAKALPAKGGQT